MFFYEIGISLSLFSAFTTSSAHALLKNARDKMAIRAMVGLVGSVIVGPACFFVSPPDAVLIPWLGLACGLHTAYQLILLIAYTHSDFSVAYPISRGVAPLAVASLGAVFLGDLINRQQQIGTIIICIGIATFLFGKSLGIKAISANVCAGLLIAAYTIVDAHAVRISLHPATFIVWFFLLDGIIMMPLFLIARGKYALSLLFAEGSQGVLAGLTSLTSFGAALIALRLAPAGTVSALRETSVAFSLIISAFILREKVSLYHLVAATLIILGAVVIVLFRP